jgi:hypothetical protein
MRGRLLTIALVCGCVWGLPFPAFISAQAPRVDNVLVVTLDGMRWQEVFGGLVPELLTKEAGGVSDAAPLQARFGGASAEVRREKLMPFLWTIVGKRGQIFGDPSQNSVARVTNGLRFSYPGYNELLSGFADPGVDSNDKVLNPNVTVLEWLNGQPSFRGRVAAFGSWELLPWILNESRSGIPSNGEGPPIANPVTDRERLINAFAAELPPYWGSTRFDAPTAIGALEYLKTHRPRVFYVMLGETDEWAHGRRYDLYLDAAWRNDRFIRQLWETAQTLPEYANRTALLITTDHGRGSEAKDWPTHGREVPAADRIWIAGLGPTVPGLGIRKGGEVTQAQVAATIAALLGEDFLKAQPKAARPINWR